jgi:ATP-dependent Clp protease ATP-binding subunit ClpA
MFERYTEKARRVIFFARYEASEFGDPLIEPKFLLLGLLRESPQVVTRWLDKQTDWPAAFRTEIAQSLEVKPHLPTSVDLPLSDDAKRVLAYAAEEAQRLGHQHIGTEHLFLGLLREPESYVGKMLHNFGVNIHIVRETLAKEGEQHGASGLGTGSGGSMSRQAAAALRIHQVVIMIEGVSEPLQVQWSARIPAIGETISLESGIYRVANVEWTVDKQAGRPASLAKVVMYLRSIDDAANR